MKILYTGIRFEHYNPRRRESFEYNNFYLTLAAMPGVEVVEHPFDRILEVGKKKYNEELLALVEKEKPSALFAFMYTDELDPATLLRIKDKCGVTTIAWFADDYWRFFNYSKYWPPYFHYVVTTYSKAVGWYKAKGFNNILRSQWACNSHVYRPTDLPKDIEVSFVGQYKSKRAAVIEDLKRRGINVQTYGFGWPNGKVSQDEMLRIFSRSKINLNLNVRPSIFHPKVLARIFLKKSINKVVPDYHLIDNVSAWRHFSTLHTHARPFELAGCKAFTISGLSEDIPDSYVDGKEMVFYRTTDELVEKIRYYLAHEDERERIARAGYDRTMREHTYEKRFEEVFRRAGIGK